MSSAVVATPRAAELVWRDVFALLKLRIGMLIAATAVASALAAGQTRPGVLLVLFVAALSGAQGAVVVKAGGTEESSRQGCLHRTFVPFCGGFPAHSASSCRTQRTSP